MIGRLCFVKRRDRRDRRSSPATVVKRKTPSGENHIGVWRWSREELRLVLTIQHTNNTHTVEQQWEFYSDLSLIIDIQARPTVCTPPHRDRGRRPLSGSGGDNNGLMGISSGGQHLCGGGVGRSCPWCSLYNTPTIQTSPTDCATTQGKWW